MAHIQVRIAALDILQSLYTVLHIVLLPIYSAVTRNCTTVLLNLQCTVVSKEFSTIQYSGQYRVQYIVHNSVQYIVAYSVQYSMQ